MPIARGLFSRRCRIWLTLLSRNYLGLKGENVVTVLQRHRQLCSSIPRQTNWNLSNCSLKRILDIISHLIICCYFANNPAGISSGNNSTWYILCNNTAGTDNTLISNSNPGHYFYIAAKPHFVTNMYWLTGVGLNLDCSSMPPRQKDGALAGEPPSLALKDGGVPL